MELHLNAAPCLKGVSLVFVVHIPSGPSLSFFFHQHSSAEHGAASALSAFRILYKHAKIMHGTTTALSEQTF